MEPTKTPSSGKLLKRSQAARLLGVSVSTLRRREGEVLKPIVGSDGVHLFDEAEVRAVTVTMRARAAMTAMGASAGDTAADVFTLLDDGAHPVDIVKRLRLTPDVVVALQDQWSRMRGGFFVGPEEARELGLVTRSRAPTTAPAALALVRDRVSKLTRMRQGAAVCHSCRDHTASICEACVIATRGPLSTLGIRVEHRTSDAGEEIRVAADVYWDDVGGEGGTIAAMCSDWFASSDADTAPIADIVVGIRQRSG